MTDVFEITISGIKYKLDCDQIFYKGKHIGYLDYDYKINEYFVCEWLNGYEKYHLKNKINDKTNKVEIIFKMDKIIKNSNKTIRFEDIELFYKTCSRGDNDSSNKIRENIICKIINDDIPLEWYNNNNKWFHISNEVWKYLEENKPFNYTEITCKSIGGRKNNDFDITYKNSQTNETLIIKKEFKFNASEIHDCPQWVSPMHPSRFMTENFEEYHYNNHLESICKIFNLEIPNKDDFITKIHYEKPECVLHLQKAYYKGSKTSSKCSGDETDINKCDQCKKISKKSISEFLDKTELNVSKLNDYLFKSQIGKQYMLFDYNAKNFNNEIPNKKDYTIKSESIKKTENSFVGENESGKKINILLRWKNGNGIAFPAFQIK